MSKTIQIRVDKSFPEALEEYRKKVANEIKGTYGLQEIKVPATLASQILAAQMRGQKRITFKINKSGLNRGFIEIIG